jgi:hypothetical protein
MHWLGHIIQFVDDWYDPGGQTVTHSSGCVNKGTGHGSTQPPKELVEGF